MNPDYHSESQAAKPGFSRVFFVTGDVAEGKTTFISQLVGCLKAQNRATGGFYAPRLMSGQNTTGYDLVRIASGESIPFLREYADRSHTDIGKYSVREEAFSLARTWLSEDIRMKRKPIIIDEVGKWELVGKGWKEELDLLLALGDTPLVWVVRRPFIEDVIRGWQLANPVIFDIAQSDPEIACKTILEKLTADDPI